MKRTAARADANAEMEGAWSELFEDLLRGIVHAMNNRLTALSAFAELAAMDDDDVEIEILREEISRMSGASALVGLLVSRGDAEALEVRPVLDSALDVHTYHPRARAIRCVVEQSVDVLPVRVARWALLRALLLFVDIAKREGEAARLASVSVRVTGDDRSVRVHVVARGAASADATRLAGLCGGRIETVGNELVLELPSLPELRRRERAG